LQNKRPFGNKGKNPLENDLENEDSKFRSLKKRRLEEFEDFGAVK